MTQDVCGQTKKNGEPCRSPATYPDRKCFAHTSANAEVRRVGSAKGGRGSDGLQRTLQRLTKKLETIGDELKRGGPVNRANYAVAVSAYGASIKGVEALIKYTELITARQREVDLKEFELREVAERIEDLEAVMASSKKVV